MKVYRDTEAEAQDLADQCHAWLLENDPAYSGSVDAGFTTCWSLVARDGTFDESGNWVPTVPEQWFILVSERVKEALPQADQDALWPPEQGMI